MPTPPPIRGLLLTLILWAVAAGPASGELILTASPMESAEAAQTLYAPLASHLEALLGEPVVFEHPRDWLTYQRNLRDDRYDLVFDDPHLVSWRIDHSHHRPLVKLPSPLQFYVVKRAGNAKVGHLRELASRAVCALAPPHLGTVLLYQSFPNPVRQPRIVEISGDARAVFDALLERRCEAAVLPSRFLERALGNAQRATVEVIHVTRSLPSQALTAGPELPEEMARRIVLTLTSDARGVKATALIRARFDAAAPALVPASVEEYRGHGQLLEGQVHGW